MRSQTEEHHRWIDPCGVITRQEGAEEYPFMVDRLIISDNREDPGNPLVLDGEAIDAALNQSCSDNLSRSFAL